MMVYEADSSPRRFLLKAIRESTGELYGQLAHIGEAGLRWRPAPGEWCLKEIAAHLRDAEQLHQRQIELIVSRDEPRLPDEPIDVLPSERDYREQPLRQFLEDYEAAREETVWMLRMLDEDDWQRAGLHPYRGRITLIDLVREIHEHDLDHLYQARRLRESLPRR
jgi:hypothetical protein